MSWANIPSELKELNQWVNWRTVVRDGKPTKMPFMPSGDAADSTAPSTWGSFDAVTAAAGRFDGIGFVFSSSDPYTGIDIDKLSGPDDPRLAHVERLQSYTEWSQSGNGLHVICRAVKPGDRCKHTKRNVEIYDHDRFFVMTGKVDARWPVAIEGRQTEVDAAYRELWPDQAPQPASHSASAPDVLGRMFASKNGDHIRSLWNGNLNGYGDDESAADLALMNHLAFWTDNDAGMMERLFGESQLGQRDKWRDRADYRERTIGKAIEGTPSTVGDSLRLTVPDGVDVKRWALDHAGELAKLDRVELTGILMDLEDRGATVRFIERRLTPIINEKRAETSDEPGLWSTIKTDLVELGYTVRLNDLDESVEVNGERMTDSLEAVMQMEMVDRGRVSAEWNRRGIVATARQYRYNPVHQFLESLQWDGRDRIAELERYIRDAHPRVEYADGSVMPVFGAWLRRWGIGAVAKAWGQEAVAAQNPVLVFVGGQNLGKSTLARWLCPMGNDYYLESPINPDDKDHLRYAATKLVWEIAELGATTRKADREALKSFLTRVEVTIRPAYARNDIRKPAICSFIGTINPEIGFLNDPTGHRRFLPVELTHIDHGYFQDVDPVQLWAQFARLYRDGETWRLTPEEWMVAQKIRGGHEVEQPMAGFILKYFDIEAGPAATMTTVDIVERLKAKGVNDANVTNVGLALRALGMEKLEEARPVAWAGIGERTEVVFS